jgi:hypothetical protein
MCQRPWRLVFVTAEGAATADDPVSAAAAVGRIAVGTTDAMNNAGTIQREKRCGMAEA